MAEIIFLVYKLLTYNPLIVVHSSRMTLRFTLLHDLFSVKSHVAKIEKTGNFNILNNNKNNFI